MPRQRATTPAGHGELVCVPPFEDWGAGARANAADAAGWRFEVDGRPVGELRELARSEAVGLAGAFSDRLGVPVRPLDAGGLLVVTGHQPEIYHPGVWVKDFLMQRLSDETGASAIDLVVDSDGFDAVEVHSPCLSPEVRVCRAYLAVGTDDGCFAAAPVPSADDIGLFSRAGEEHLGTLPAPALLRHFRTYAAHLGAAASDARNLAELLTIARRRFEASAATDYAELPVTSLASSRAFAAFAGHIARDAGRFADAYDGALSEFRQRTGTRSAAQPFPDLRRDGALVELPLWDLSGGRRRAVWARSGSEPAIVVDGRVVCELGEAGSAADPILGSQLALAPKALALTLFVRTFVADWFIHGVGGGRYDQVTDEVFRRYWGVEPPAFAVASLTMYLPLGAHLVTDEEVDRVAGALNRLKHNPDRMLDELEFESADERERAFALASEKTALVGAIAAPDADKKALGARIRVVNEELAAMLRPVETQLTAELEQLRQMREAAEIMTDRTYPLCLWDPVEVADKVR